MYHNIHRSELAIESGCSIPADSRTTTKGGYDVGGRRSTVGMESFRVRAHRKLLQYVTLELALTRARLLVNEMVNGWLLAEKRNRGGINLG